MLNTHRPAHRSSETKYETSRPESGENSLTRFLAAPGLTSLECGADGVGHAGRSWPGARPLFTPVLPQLLVADNQTRGYAEASVWRRRNMETWRPALAAADGAA